MIENLQTHMIVVHEFLNNDEDRVIFKELNVDESSLYPYFTAIMGYKHENYRFINEIAEWFQEMRIFYFFNLKETKLDWSGLDIRIIFYSQSDMVLFKLTWG